MCKLYKTFMWEMRSVYLQEIRCCDDQFCVIVSRFTWGQSAESHRSRKNHCEIHFHSNHLINLFLLWVVALLYCIYAHTQISHPPDVVFQGSPYFHIAFNHLTSPLSLLLLSSVSSPLPLCSRVSVITLSINIYLVFPLYSFLFCIPFNTW